MAEEVPEPPAEQLDARRAYPNLCNDYDSLLARYSWDVSTAKAIMQAESGCNPIRDNSGLNSDGTADVGLMQINSIHVTSGLTTHADRLDPAKNIETAWKLYQGAGGRFTPWVAYNTGAYRQFIN